MAQPLEELLDVILRVGVGLGEGRRIGEVMTALQAALPFPLLGFDTDTDTVFLNETIKGWCEAADVAFTRSRPYRKNDQAHVEQKNGAVVRRMVGYRRYEPCLFMQFVGKGCVRLKAL